MRSIFIVNKKDRSIINDMLADDVVGRQSLYEREGENYGLKPEEILIVFSGSDDAFSRIKKEWGDRIQVVSGADEQKILNQIDKENSDALEGMGFLFSG